MSKIASLRHFNAGNQSVRLFTLYISLFLCIQECRYLIKCIKLLLNFCNQSIGNSVQIGVTS